MGNGRGGRAVAKPPPRDDFSRTSISMRLERIEELLEDMSGKMDDKFETVIRGIDTVAPHQKGAFLSRLEERVLSIKRDMAAEAVIAECVRETKSYAELRKTVRARTGLSISSAFLDACVRRLEYEGKIQRVGNRYSASGEIAKEAANAPDARDAAKAAGLVVDVAEPGGGSPLGDTDLVLKVVRELESKAGPVPVEAVVAESERRGINKDNVLQIIDEHLMVTGSLYEPKEGFVKVVKPLTA
jgi:hypothetical protein